MDKNERKYKQILSKDTGIPAQVKKQAALTYSIIISENNENETIREFCKMRKHHNRRFILLAAALTLAFGTTALAAVKHWGLTDFFAKSGKELPQQASSLIETEINQENAENAFVNFKIREAICDNKSIYVVLEARPVNPDKYLLLAMDAYYNDPAANMGIEVKNGETLVEYAKETNREMLYVSPSLSDNGTLLLTSADYTTEEDGTVVFILKGNNIATTENMNLTCNTIVNTIDQNGNYGEAIKDSFNFQLSNKSSEVTACYLTANPIVVEDTGVIIDKIEISQTELGIYTELTFHIAPDATDDMTALAKDGLWFEYLDDSGEAWESGLSGIGKLEEISDGVFVQKNNFEERELPDTITVRGFDCWNKTRFGSMTLNKE